MEHDLIQVIIKKRIFIIFFLISQVFPIFSQTIQIGSSEACVPSTNLNCTQIRIPVSTNNNYTYSQQIIHKQKILENGWTNNMQYLTRIRYFINNSNFNGLINSDHLCIYLGTTQKEKFDSISDWIPISSMSVVLDTLIVHPLGESWWEIVFQTPFYFDGNDNLVIAIHEKKWYYTPQHTYYLSTIDTCNSGIYTTVSGPTSNIINPFTPNPGNLVSQVPIVQLYFEEACSLPILFRLNSVNHSTAAFNWIPNGTETLWNLRYKKSHNPTWNEINNISSPSYIMSNLFSLEEYSVQIQANCINENSEWTNPIFFETPIDSSYEYSVDWDIFKNNTLSDYSLMDTIFPDLVIKLDSINTPNIDTKMDKFLSRVMGYILPRKTGLYNFYFGCDDIGEFWLSSDEGQSNAVLAISINSISTDWSLNQYSQYLFEGEKYFFKILHYDSVFTDMIKLGWIIPGDSTIRTIKNPFITTSGNYISSQGLCFLSNKITGYQGYQQKIEYKTIPWNVSDKRVIWSSSDTSISKVNNNGLVTLSGAGSCIIYGRMYDNNAIFDSVLVEVWTYKGPFYVKPDAPLDGTGLDWDNPIDLQTILNISKNRILNDTIIIFVSEGLYKPSETIDRNISFHLHNLELYGGYNILSSGTDTTMRNPKLFETIFNGDIGDQGFSYDNSYHVVVATKYVLIDGITISDGAARSSDNRPFTSTYTYIDDDNGGGLIIPRGIKSNVMINMCEVKNNIAFNGGAGIFIAAYSNSLTNASKINIRNSKVYNNEIKVPSTPFWGWFNLIINSYGGGIVSTTSEVNLRNSEVFNNFSQGLGKNVFLAGSNVNIQNCSFFNDTLINGNSIDVKDGSGTMTINNSTIYGGLGFFGTGGGLISNSTIIGSGYLNLIHPDSKVIINNSIWSNINLHQYPLNLYDTSKVQFINSIVRNVLYGQNFQDSLYINLPSSYLWLDNLAYNGGNTPTMKLKHVPFNPAKSLGNPIYIGTHDQRGALRLDSVSIGAYQWVNPTGIVGSVHNLSICLSDSIELDAQILPSFVSVNDFHLTCLDTNVITISGNIINAVGPGQTTLYFNTFNENFSDSCFIEVIGNVESGIISGDTNVCHGQNIVTYVVSDIPFATNYHWTLPIGFIGMSSTNSISVLFDSLATSGYITIRGENQCGFGESSSLYVTVNYSPETPEITFEEDRLISSSVIGNQWYNENGAIPNETNQELTPTENGTYYVIVTQNDCSSNPSNSILVNNVQVQNFDKNLILISPNPFTNQLSIKNQSSEIYQYYMYNGVGQQVLEGTLNTEVILNTSDLTKGLYIIKFVNNLGQVYYKMIKQ